jgi:hypothetical protein
MKKVNASITDLESLTFLYKQTADQLFNTRKQQWAITLYCLLLNVLLLSVFAMLDPGKSIFLEPIICAILSIFINLTGIVYLVIQQNSVIKLKMRLRRIHKHLPSDKYVILEKPSMKFTSMAFHVYNIIIPFILVLILCSAIVSYIVLRQ